jgi:hypothetical protein
MLTQQIKFRQDWQNPGFSAAAARWFILDSPQNRAAVLFSEAPIPHTPDSTQRSAPA